MFHNKSLLSGYIDNQLAMPRSKAAQGTNLSISDFFKDETAQSTVEYILITTVMCVFAYGAIKLFATAFGTKFNKTKNLRTGIIGIGP